jgi:hypothetical protein
MIYFSVEIDIFLVILLHNLFLILIQFRMYIDLVFHDQVKLLIELFFHFD